MRDSGWAGCALHVILPDVRPLVLGTSMAAMCAVAAACTEPFEAKSIVLAPRILAIVAEPPEAAPGEDVRLSTMVAFPRAAPDARAPDVELRYRACPRLDDGVPGFAGMQYGAVQDDRGCRGDAPFVIQLDVAPDGTATLPGALTAVAFDNLEAAAATYGDLLPAETLALIVETTGLPVAIEVDLYVDGAFVMRAFKRVLLTRRETRGTNPPHPRFAVSDSYVQSRTPGTSPFVCVPESAAPIVEAAGVVELTPTRLRTDESADAGVADPNDVLDDDWRETFPVIDIRGELLEAHEGAYYAWFATGGHFTREETREPDPVTRWTPPDVHGELHHLWLVVRDGHGGTSACSAAVEVVRTE